MYILIDYISNYSGKCTMSYEDFADLKGSVIDKLDGRGWDNKHNVDLRSLRSCIDYLFSDYRSVGYKKSKSYKKFCEYRFGSKRKSP